MRWVALGDSLSSQQGGGATYNGWVDQVQMRSLGRMLLASNAGVTGNTTAQMLARLSTDVLAYTPKLVTVLGGTNDITQSVSAATTKANLASIVTTLQAAGIAVVMCTIPPRQDTTSGSSTAGLNAWIRQYAGTHGCYLLDVYKATVDRTTNQYASGYAADSVHMLKPGHTAVADRFLTDILPQVTYGSVIRSYTNADPANLITNSLLLGTLTGGIPTGYAASGTTTGLTEGLQADTDFEGGQSWQVALATPSSFRQLTWSTASGWSVGDRLLFTCRFKVTASSSVPTTSGFAVQANFFSAASPTNYVTRYQSTLNFSGLAAQEYVVPASTTLVQIAAIFTPSSAGTETVRVGEFGIFNLTTLGATA